MRIQFRVELKVKDLGSLTAHEATLTNPHQPINLIKSISIQTQ